jgi:hypothetical protein
MVSQPQTNSATLDLDIVALGASLAALRDMARSLPAGIAVPHDRRGEFAALEARVNSHFDRLSYALAAIEGDKLH